MNKTDLGRIADQLERTAALIREHGMSALQRTADWQSPLRAMSYDSPIVAGGGVSDPTGNGAASRSEAAEAAKDRGRLLWGLRMLSDNATRVANLVVPRDPPSTTRKGVGYCACGAYCDGDSRRLVPVKGFDERMCWTCRSREDRATAKATTTGALSAQAATLSARPPRTVITGVWHQGVGDLAGDELAAAIEDIQIRQLPEGRTG